MNRPVQASPRLRRSHVLAAASRSGIRPSLCVNASCTPQQCCASILGHNFCIPNPLGVQATASCCAQLLPPGVCCSINGTQIGCLAF